MDRGGWYRFEQHGRATVTVFDFGDVQARTGAKGTRFFKKVLESNTDPRRVAEEALRRMDEVRRRWPWPDWPKPAGLQSHEQEIVLPAFLLATGEDPERVDKLVRRGG